MAEGIYGKKCPKCGHFNDEFAMVCSKGCQGGLSRISAQYHKQKETQEDTTEILASKDIKSQIKPSTLNNDKATIRMGTQYPRLYCESSSDFVMEIKDGYVIGREGNINVTPLPRSEYISRRHAIFIQTGNDWFLKVESGINPTTVNFKQLESGEMEPLKNDDRITLADTTFIFRSL